MQQRPSSAMRRHVFQPLAVAAAVALMLGAMPAARAQSFSSVGANSTSPVNLLPFAGAPTVLNFGDNILYVGNAALGSFSALAGAVLNAGALSIANGGAAGVGTVTLSGAGTKVELGANLNRLEVGNWGSGTLTVTGGALLDAAVNSGNCSNCFNVVGNGAGSTGTLTISGTGSEVSTLRGFVVGQTAVFTNPPDGTTFGTPGGTTTASVSVVSGGTLRTEGATVASNNRSPSGNGLETVTGTVVVSGTNSQWIVLRNSIDTAGNTAALMSIGNGAEANGLVTVSSGGKLHIDGTGSSGPNDGLHIGGSGKGKLTVTGTSPVTGIGSQVMTSGVNHFVHVGGINSLGDGSFEILAGASASTLYLNVGLNGGVGKMLIDGAGSTLTQSGVGIFQAAFVNGPAGASIGRDMGGGGGTGIVTVSNGGQWLISDGGGDGRTPAFGPSITVGHGANSAGSLTITGSGSKVEITASSLNPGAGVGDNYNPFVSIGFDNADTSSGELNILAGGKLVLNGNAVSAPGALSRATGVNIGGRSGAAGTGTATVNGSGSEIRIAGSDGYINVGRTDGSTGTLNVQNQALVTVTSLSVGIGSTTPGTGQALGTVNIDNAKILLSGFRTDTTPQIGAGTTFGRGANGVAVLNISNGGQLEISPVGFGGGMSIGGDQFLGGGLATVTLSGGSSIVRGGPRTGIGMNIGWSGTGIVALSGASLIDVGTGAISLASVPTAGQSTGNGSLSLASGSKASADAIFIGGNSLAAGVAGIGGTGAVFVSGLGSELKASGANGYIGVGSGGNGTLTVTEQGKVSAIGLAVGRNNGVGQLLTQNATIELSGQQTAGTSPSGAFMVVGSGGAGPDGANRPGTGIVTLVDSTLTISNAGSLGAGVSVGGSGSFPGGTGILQLTNSQLTVNAAAEVSIISIGRTGVGVATLSASTITNTNASGNGNVFIGREVGSSGLVTLGSGSVINADYVGVGVSAKGVVGPNNSVTQFAGGTGTLILNDSTINASMFELGAGGLLTGNNGTVDVLGDGPIVIGGTVAPGNSPGKLRFKSNVIMLPDSRIELEISGSGNDLSGYEFDQLIIGEDSIFDLAGAEIVFTFLGDTNPNIVSKLGGLDLNNYFRAGSEVAEIDAPTQSLQTVFASGQTWADVIDTSKVSAVSANPNFSSVDIVSFDPVTGMAQVVAMPEPSTWGMLFLGLAAVGAVSRRRKLQAVQA